MNDELTISDPQPVASGLLPYNYLPAAFANLAAPFDAPNRIVFQLPNADDAPRKGIRFHVASGKTLSSTDDLAAFLKQRDYSDADAFERCILGPPTAMAETSIDDAQTMKFGRLHLSSAEDIDQVAVIIDIGIAFWNDRFRNGGRSRFRAMRYLDFDAFLGGRLPFAGLEEADIAKLCRDADGPNGTSHVVAELGRQFPDSYFGPKGGAVPGSLWHGTATADLMAGLPKDTADKTALFGIELPMAVLRDADGDSLTHVLTLLVEAALEMTSPFKNKPLLILLPWGFSAGQQDGSHPAATAIQNALSAVQPRSVKMLAPAGNQLQDRCCGQLLPSQSQQPDQAIWHLPPDDFSTNTIEVFVAPSAPAAPSGVQVVRISPPHGASFVVAIKENHIALIWQDGQPIGVLLRRPDRSTGPHLRLTFAGTGWRTFGQRPTPAGSWKLSFARTDAASLWVLRDDRDRMLDGPLPRRSSWLTDVAYKEKDVLGSFNLADDPGSSVVRSGTMSVLATASGVIAVQANELMIGQPSRTAFYSGRKANGVAPTAMEVVDKDLQASGITVAVNGSNQRARFTGSSAAVAIHARRQLGIPPYAS